MQRKLKKIRKICLIFHITAGPPFLFNQIKLNTNLAGCELMNLSLWDSPDVVVGRVGRLLHEQQCDPLEQLVAGHSRDGQVEEQAVQHRQGNDVHWAEIST